MIRRRLSLARLRHPAPIAGILPLLCGLGVVASTLGSAETVFRTIRLQTVRPADEALPHAGDQATWIRLCLSPIGQAPMCEMGVDEGAQEDWEARDRPPAAEAQFSRGEDPGEPAQSRLHARTDMRDQLMAAANLARHRMEPWTWTSSNEPRPPLRYGDQ